MLRRTPQQSARSIFESKELSQTNSVAGQIFKMTGSRLKNGNIFTLFKSFFNAQLKNSRANFRFRAIHHRGKIENTEEFDIAPQKFRYFRDNVCIARNA